MRFDASIGLTAARLAQGELNPVDAVTAVRKAVRGLPGADYVDVEWVGEVPAVVEDQWLALYSPGRSESLPEPDYSHAKFAIQEAITIVLRRETCK